MVISSSRFASQCIQACVFGKDENANETNNQTSIEVRSAFLPRRNGTVLYFIPHSNILYLSNTSSLEKYDVVQPWSRAQNLLLLMHFLLAYFTAFACVEIQFLSIEKVTYFYRFKFTRNFSNARCASLPPFWKISKQRFVAWLSSGRYIMYRDTECTTYRRIQRRVKRNQ